MAMVIVDASCLQADSQPKSGGLVWGSAAACRCFVPSKLSQWPLWSWWQQYKYHPG